MCCKFSYAWKAKSNKKQSFSLVCAFGWQLSIANSYSSQSYLMDMSVDGGQVINLKMTISSSLRLVNQICSRYSKVARQHCNNSLPAVQHTSDYTIIFHCILIQVYGASQGTITKQVLDNSVFTVQLLGSYLLSHVMVFIVIPFLMRCAGLWPACSWFL